MTRALVWSLVALGCTVGAVFAAAAENIPGVVVILIVALFVQLVALGDIAVAAQRETTATKDRNPRP
jgi:hypothetical protein